MEKIIPGMNGFKSSVTFSTPDFKPSFISAQGSARVAERQGLRTCPKRPLGIEAPYHQPVRGKAYHGKAYRGKAYRGKVYRGKVYHGFTGFGQVLAVSGEPSVAAQPAEGFSRRAKPGT